MPLVEYTTDRRLGNCWNGIWTCGGMASASRRAHGGAAADAELRMDDGALTTMLGLSRWSVRVAITDYEVAGGRRDSEWRWGEGRPTSRIGKGLTRAPGRNLRNWLRKCKRRLRARAAVD